MLEHGFERGLPGFAQAIVHHPPRFGAQTTTEVAHGVLARALAQGKQRITGDDHALTSVGHADLAAAEIELQSVRRIEVEAHGGFTAGSEPGAFRKYRVAWVNPVNSPAIPRLSGRRAEPARERGSGLESAGQCAAGPGLPGSASSSRSLSAGRWAHCWPWEARGVTTGSAAIHRFCSAQVRTSSGRRSRSTPSCRRAPPLPPSVNVRT